MRVKVLKPFPFFLKIAGSYEWEFYSHAQNSVLTSPMLSGCLYGKEERKTNMSTFLQYDAVGGKELGVCSSRHCYDGSTPSQEENKYV